MIHIEDIKGIVCIFLKWGCMRYLSIVSILSTVDLGRHTPSLEKQAGVPAWKLSNVLLCKLYFSHLKKFLKKQHQFKCALYLEYFHHFLCRQPFPLALRFLKRTTSVFLRMLRTLITSQISCSGQKVLLQCNTNGVFFQWR